MQVDVNAQTLPGHNLHYQMAPVLQDDDVSTRAKLADSLSNSFPGSTLSRMLQRSMDEDDTEPDRLVSSCFGELRLEKLRSPTTDSDSDDSDDLTSLDWLQDSNLLKNIGPADGDWPLRASSPFNIADEEIRAEMQFQPTFTASVAHRPRQLSDCKPPYSFSCLIFMAIEETASKRIPVKEIYSWIQINFPYFRTAPTGWKNSIRHNLSLNRCFMKVGRSRGKVETKKPL